MTPKDSQQWIRKVEEEFMPRIGMEFEALEDGIEFYRIYAIACGFDIRKSSQKRFRDQTIRTKLILCHREGFGESKKTKNMVSMKPNERSKKQDRVTTIRRFWCRAMIKLVFKSGKYVINQFREEHNHPLVLVKNREFQKLSRNLTLYHKQTIINNLKVNIGASKTFRICKEVANGYENVGASLLDFKNFRRQVKLFIGDANAQIFINNLEKLVERKKDAHGKSAYSVFGDGISFDPTYGTNRYYMVFTPFTGIDNHKKSVTFACALLQNEDEESFVWVFQKFMVAMGRQEPHIIITDQDPAIRNSVPVVFKTARHRFCMWHIMKKVPDKIDIITRKDTDFLSRLNGIVWNKELDPTEFDDKWNEIIIEFGLEDNRWLSTMFDMKEYWIPAYFRDLHMGDIMSTTQRSESENSFFKKFENHYVFYEIQEEIKSSMCGCGIVGYSRSASVELSNIEDSERRKTFSVFSNKLLRTIPEKYIMPQWSKDALRGPIYDLDGNIIQNYDTKDVCQLEMSKVWSDFYNVISVVTNKEADILRNLQRVLKDFKETIEPTNERLSKQQEMEMLIGCSVVNEVRILPPRQSKNKGSGKRMNGFHLERTDSNTDYVTHYKGRQCNSNSDTGRVDFNYCIEDGHVDLPTVTFLRLLESTHLLITDNHMIHLCHETVYISHFCNPKIRACSILKWWDPRFLSAALCPEYALKLEC
ncbi:hypothetical protein RND81_14G107700 [Saponaria officinalis]|uniref:Protein FAR1-RELATED SEQUENCE n=1 Tax=Saponaria officinalis TaxID=3572 RepID=A0AAW1GNY9_SAPOF